VWAFYQLQLMFDSSGPAFQPSSTNEGKRTRGCPSPLLHARRAHRPGRSLRQVGLPARRGGREGLVVAPGGRVGQAAHEDLADPEGLHPASNLPGEMPAVPNRALHRSLHRHAEAHSARVSVRSR
jgi:hypothetical protein